MLTVTPDEAGAVGWVESSNPAAQFETGAGVGATYEEVLATFGALTCRGGVEASAEQISCTSKRAPAVLVFDVGTTDHSERKLDSTTQARLLAGKRVRTINWAAK